MNGTSVITQQAIFEQHFKRAPELEAFAPGRVNLIGEHTDYNLGLVLPSPIPQRSRLTLAQREDNTVKIFAANLNETLEYQLGQEFGKRGWLNYFQAVTQVLAEENITIRGFDAVFSSEVPLGSGLSSSASLLVATLRGLRAAFQLSISDVQVAQWAQRAENSAIVGARVGLMDQMACSVAEAGQALFINFRHSPPEFDHVALPENADLVIIHSGITHNLADASHGTRNYKTRRNECEHACNILEVECLSDMGLNDLPRLAALDEPDRSRARHVITENARVSECVAAMRAGNLERIGELFCESHASMTRDYDMSEPEIDTLVRIANARNDVYGARLTGGGFGGSVVILTHKGLGRSIGEAVMLEYAAQTGQSPRLILPV
jgi:galactokinase